MHYRTMQRSNDDWFLIFTPQSLGEIRSIRVWHDNGGSDPEWYCRRIMVIEVRGNNSTEFEVEQWFSLTRQDKSIEYVFNSGPRSYKWKKQARELFEMTVREKHMWASVFLRYLCIILFIGLSIYYMFLCILFCLKVILGRFSLGARG